MNRMDLTPFRRSTVGFDRVFDLMERQARNAGGDNSVSYTHLTLPTKA